ncbi:MAG: hypothetical protein ACE5G6_02745 [Terriglobia bacterium]
MRRLLVLLGLATAATAVLAAPPTPLPSQEGRLSILQNGQPVGWERYRIVRTDTEVQARSESQFQSHDQKVQQRTSLLLNADLSPRRYEWNIEGDKQAWLRMDFQDSTATVRYPLPTGKEDQQVFKFGTTRVALLDNNVFHHFLLLVQFYDFSAGGPQTVQVFVPQSVQPGEAIIELLGVETQTVDGQPQPVRQLAITTADNQVMLSVTESGQFLRLWVPLANVEVVPAETAETPP